MKKFLAAIFFLFLLASTAHGQAHKYFDVSVNDPSNFTLFPATTLNTFPTGGFFNQYIVNVPYGMQGLTIQISATSASDTLQLNTSCAPSPLITDTNMISYPFVPVTQATNTSYTFIPGLQTDSLTSNIPRILTIPTNGCARIDIALGSPAGTLTDVVTANGQFTFGAPANFAGGPGGIYQMALSSGGVPQTLQSANNQLLTTQADIAGVVNADPCQSNGNLKQSVAATITTPATTNLISTSGSSLIWVCAIFLEINSSTASTAQFEYGTGSTCTSPTTVTPAWTNTSAPLFFNISAGNMATFKVPPTDNFCVVTTVGTGPQILIAVTFVQI